jgi:alanine dehydrogenase
MDAGLLTAYRTGAAGAVAAKYLARPDSKTLGLIGTGMQARYQLIAIAELFDLDEIKIYDISAEAEKKFKAEFSDYNIKRCKLPEAVNADIVATCTPVRNPIVKAEWVKPGTHINAIGADAPGKEELDPSLLTKSKIIVDSIEQARHSGEINVPLTKGLIKEKDLYSTLGEVVAGIKKGRENEREITIFDSTGLAIQDVAVAKLVYEKKL